jgi:predicted SnoaL-like aldol condensation-catalyzing enzyme
VGPTVNDQKTLPLLSPLPQAGTISHTPDRNATEQENLRLALELWYDVIVPIQIALLGRYIDERYTEHTPGPGGGLPNLVRFFTEIKQQLPGGLPPGDALMCLADGDLTLLIVGSAPAAGGGEPGPHGGIRLEMQRWKRGLQVEHWDQDAVAEADTSNSSFARTPIEQRSLLAVLELVPERSEYIHALVDGDLVALVEATKNGLRAHVFRVWDAKIVQRWSTPDR